MVMQQASASCRFHRSNALSTRDDERETDRLHTHYVNHNILGVLSTCYLRKAWLRRYKVNDYRNVNFLTTIVYDLLNEQRSLRNIKRAMFIILSGSEAIAWNPLEIIVPGKGYHGLQHRNNPEAGRKLYIIVILQISLSRSRRHPRFLTNILYLDNVI